jgi:hypothetical protein
LQIDVRFGSLADICNAKGHVRFAPNSDRESGFPQTVMSALPPKADMCGAARDVRFGPIADIRVLFDHLVGAPEKRHRDQRLGGLEVQDQLDLGRLLLKVNF